jgi:hypothetical protein
MTQSNTPNRIPYQIDMVTLIDPKCGVYTAPVRADFTHPRLGEGCCLNGALLSGAELKKLMPTLGHLFEPSKVYARIEVEKKFTFQQVEAESLAEICAASQEARQKIDEYQRKVKAFDDLYNEGGEGYNPYRG